MFSQRDDNYKRILMGETAIPIENEGCLLCDLAYAIDTYGNACDPALLNRWLGRNTGYVQGNHIVFNSVKPLGLDFRAVYDYRGSLADMTVVHSVIEDGYVVFVSVDFVPGAGYNEHWLLACDFCCDDLDCLDPYVLPDRPPHVSVLTHYGRPDWDLARAIYRVAVYDFIGRKVGQPAF